MARKKRKARKQQNAKRGKRERREHFGHGALAAHHNTSVFINCPYDAEYAPLFDAIVFAVTCGGFLARSALETGNVADSRMARIARAVMASKYSIHDLTRCRGEGDEGLARFNMPLELGIALGMRMVKGEAEHDWLILAPNGHQYVKFVSDLAGYDPKTHDGTIESVVPKVLAWLATREDAVYVPTPDEVLVALPAFQQKKQEGALAWHGEMPWADLILAARECVPE